MGRANKGQHIIPSLYLGAFTDNGDYLWVLSQANNELRFYRERPKNLLKEKDYYTIQFKDGNRTLKVETDILNGIETKYAELYSNRISKHQYPVINDKAILSAFVASMLERTPARRSDFLRHAHKILWDTPNYEKNIHKLFNDSHSFHASAIPDRILMTAPIIFNMRHRFLIRDGSEQFITSDNPALLINRKFSKSESYKADLSQIGAEITLPLSPDLALMCSWTLETDGSYMTITDASVRDINNRTMQRARTIAGADKNYMLKKYKKVKELRASQGFVKKGE